ATPQGLASPPNHPTERPPATDLLFVINPEGTLAFRVWPTQTPIAIDNAKSWASKHGRQYGVSGLAIIAGLLVIRGVIGLVS
ncbi:MAG: hypothetical protein ACTHQQ_06415, partial [Solirubrobacteraceae bacterium]